MEQKRKMGLGTFLGCVVAAPLAIAMIAHGQHGQTSKPTSAKTAYCLEGTSEEECTSVHVTEVLWHADNCDSNDISSAALTFARQYAASHPSQMKAAREGQERALAFVMADLRKAGVADTMKFMCRSESKWIGEKLWD